MEIAIIDYITEYFNSWSFFRIIDLLLVIYLLYELYNLIKGTSGLSIFFGIIAIYLIWKLVIFLKMPMLSEILGQFISVGVIAIIIVFQQEIRRFLLLIGAPKFINIKRRRFLFWRFNTLEIPLLDLTPIMKSIKDLSETKTGALIVITRKGELKDVVDSGVIIDAKISNQIIENIFFKNSPLHDGAIVISDNRIIAAKCILPVSENEIPDDCGLRHRAAMGLSEVTDAIVIVVSEQTGKISLFTDGAINQGIRINELKKTLENLIDVK